MTRERPRAATEAGAGAAIRARDLGFGFDEQPVLRHVDLEVPARGVVAVMGPGGVGKTTLLRTLGRWNDPLPSFWTEGDVWVGDHDLLREVPLERARRTVPLLCQKARLFTASVLDNAIAEVRGEASLTRARKVELAREVLAPHGLWDAYLPHLDEPVLSLSLGRQRMLSVARLTATGSVCLLADEPLRDLRPDDAAGLERLVLRLSERQAVFMVTHNQLEARRMSDVVCLVTAGRLVETTPAADFFRGPRTELGAEFLRSGNCWPRDAAGVAASRETLEPASPGRPRTRRPTGFHWILPGRLGGTQWPGLLSETGRDLDALADLGVDVLVTLTESPFDAAQAERRGMRAVHFPIPDMGAPDLEEALAMCGRISEWLDAGSVVVLHCKAGLGRTGTMLACTLVQRGATAVGAVHQVRCTNPLYIQSEEQLRFVSRFADHVGRPPRG